MFFLPTALRTTMVAHEGVSILVAALIGDCRTYGAAATPSGERDLCPPLLMGVGGAGVAGDFLGSDCRQELVEVVSLSLM